MTVEQRIAWLKARMDRWYDRNYSMWLLYLHEYEWLTWSYVQKTSTSGIVPWMDEAS